MQIPAPIVIHTPGTIGMNSGGYTISDLVDPNLLIVTELAIVFSGYTLATIHTSSPSQDGARNYSLYPKDYVLFLEPVVSRITTVSPLHYSYRQTLTLFIDQVCVRSLTW